jgi:hypothetical protein
MAPWYPCRFSGQTALPPLLENAASYTAGALVLLVVCKGLAYSLSLCGFRGGPTFPESCCQQRLDSQPTTS